MSRSARRSDRISSLSEHMLGSGFRSSSPYSINDYSDDNVRPSLSFKEKIQRGTWLSFLLTVFVSLMTLEGLVRKWVTTVHMVNYRTLLNSILVFACTIVFFVLVSYNNWRDGDLCRLPQKKTVLMYFFMSIGDMLAFTMIILSVAFVRASTAAMLQQAVIPMTMAISYFTLKRRYHTVHYIGAALIVGTLLTALWFSDGSTDDPQSNNFWWGLILFSSSVPAGVSSVLKESCLGHPSPSIRGNIHELNAYVALFQFIIGILFAPATFVVQNFHKGQTVNAWGVWENFADGIRCWLFSENTIIAGEHVDMCEGAFMLVSVYILLLVAVNIVALIIIFYGSATIFFVASAVTIPLITILSTFSYMQHLREPNEVLNITVMCLLLAALVIYGSKPETKPPREMSESLIIMDEDMDRISALTRGSGW